MNRENLTYNPKRLSIQLSSDGFSFCTYNTALQQYQDFTNHLYAEKIANPALYLEKVKSIFENQELLHQTYDEIILIHHNDLFTPVPRPLFDESLLKDYLKNTVKTFDNDFISYDELDKIEVNNVYIPYVNINNYIFDSFGEFTYLHSSTVFLQNILKNYSVGAKTMFVNVYQEDFQVLVLENNELQLLNHFSFETKEDFVYYILFVAEQLKMNTNEFEIHLFGNIKESDETYQLLYKYVRYVSIFNKLNTNLSSKILCLPQENYNLLQLHL
ncbi:DUF3822 family protein [Wenyingzhuangia sp. 2_MG-2023]|uniref:DUF3822 family protein n=1 Tax=Wenyingzhuangia sp. 2_MG-2023 TaxID=3062639 RepID=UPI0026E17494|nr:DUF3822 family protein [Wenyingzhuangia sp. 2_MG-2023]MDO6738929.1 DUF3822 family protein [Wenyingzhuangia sp. 2_MG-2023]